MKKRWLLIGGLVAAFTFSYAGAEELTTQTTSSQTNDATAEQNQKASDAFMAENTKKEGVVSLPSGLQYKIIKAGSGAKPGPDDKVTVNYEGKLLNGKVFDSSYQHGEPLSFSLNEIIPGWKEALQLMPVGSSWMLYIPPKLAYGDQGAGGLIGPNEPLIFKVDLISIDKK
jgi:FKBP-type peptidyl-prolyl cis-trans isomerase FklB